MYNSIGSEFFTRIVSELYNLINILWKAKRLIQRSSLLRNIQ